jgi:HK97 family phage major capsid protein
MELTDERIAEISAEAATKAVEEFKAKQDKEIVKRFTPGSDDIKVVGNPEDALLASKFGGFKNAGHFYNDVIKAEKGGKSETLRNWENAVSKTAGYMEEGDLSQGGYLVPTEVSNAIIEKTLEMAIVRPRATIQPMGSNRLEIPADVDSDHSTNYFGGITIYRPGEGGQKTATNPIVGKVGLQLHKLVGLCHVTDELLSDSVIALESYLTRKFGQAIAFVEDDDFLNGTGANMAVGAFHASNPSLITVTAVGGQGAATIIAENIAAMWARLYPAGQANAIWIANIETFPQLFSMGLAVGAGGIPVWMPAGGIAGKPYETLMGRPLIYSEKMQALGTAGDIGQAYFSQYLIGERGGLQMASSIHLKFDYDMTSFRFVLRYDGQPSWLSALTPKRGSATLSPFVVLNSTRT